MNLKDRVICINARRTKGLKEGWEYTVIHMEECVCGRKAVELAEVNNTGRFSGSRCQCGVRGDNPNLYLYSRFTIPREDNFTKRVLEMIEEQTKIKAYV